MATMKSVQRSSSLPLEDLTEERLLDQPLIRIPASAATLEGFSDWTASLSRPQYSRLSYLAGTIFIELYPGFFAFRIPNWAVASFSGFCKWIASDDVPKWGRFSYYNKELVIDMSPEEIETHNKVKEAVGRTLGNLNEELDLGEFYPDGAQLKNSKTGLSTEADATFVSWKSFKSGRARLVPRKGHRGQYMFIEGSPDWILEILSLWSAKKDLEELRELYHRSQVGEYWIIDAQGEEILFQILLRRRRGYVAVRPISGWHKSKVFGCSFRLTRKRHRMGFWQYNLETRPA